MDKLRFGLIGCGTVAGYGHLPALTSLPEAELVAISDIDEERLTEFKAKYGIDSTYTDYREVLAREDIDAVGVATPLDQHHPVVMDAAAAGKHVFCEKPIAESVKQGEEMVGAMARAGKLLAMNFESRQSDPHPEMKKLLEQGAIGDLKVLRFVGNWQGGRWAGEDRYRMLITVGLGPIVDCGIHYFDLSRWYTASEFAEINAKGIHVEDYPNPDHVIATCKMSNGALVIIETGWAYTHNTPVHEANMRIDLIGTDGIIGYLHLQTSIEGAEERRELNVYSKDRCYRQPVSAPAKAFDHMYSLFAKSVKQGTLIGLPSGNDGVKALEAALEALRQARCEGS